MSSRIDIIALADALTELGFTDPDSLCYADWEQAAAKAEVEFPVAAKRRAVLTILRDRIKHPDPFEGMPR